MAKTHLIPSKAVRYRLVPWCRDYRVGTDGSVWTRKKHGPGNSGVWRKLKLKVKHISGRLFVNLHTGSPCRRQHWYVHQLVLTVFVGPCPPGLEACHDPDRDPTNNHLSNLRWDSHKANAADSIRHGTRPHGEQNPKAKLTEAAVRFARRRYAAGGITMRQLAKQLGITNQSLCQLLLRRTWKHVR